MQDKHAKTIKAAVEAALSKDAQNSVALDVEEQFGYADIFLIFTGEVERNVQAISDAIEDAMLEQGIKTITREGRESGRWILLNFGDIVAHVFHKDERDYYDLERLWLDCPRIQLETIETNN